MKHDLGAYMERLQHLPYVRRARSKRHGDLKDGALEITTAGGRFEFALEVRTAYLDRTVTNALIALAHRRSALPIMVFSRYVSRPLGERLAAAGINFVDRVGNLHVRLGDRYHTLLLGTNEPRSTSEDKRTGPAAIQVFLTFLASPESTGWSTRRIAEISGAGKTAVAEARQRLISEGILQQLSQAGYSLGDTKALEEQFLRGYGHVLRPHIGLGRYRSSKRDPDEFVEHLAAVASREALRWALTGTAGAYELEPFHRGEETCAFLDVATITDHLRRELQLLPDKNGPISFLKFFGDIVPWPQATPHPAAHPWLVYAELLHDGAPRSIEAAGEIRQKYLEK